MNGIDGTITDRKMEHCLVTEYNVVQLDEYQDFAAEVAIYPRVYTEVQVRDMFEFVADGFDDPSDRVFVRNGVDVALEHFEQPFNRLVYPILGLVGEAGELANKLKKVARDDQGKMDLDKSEEIEKELGDVTWYIAAVARELGVKLSKVASDNITKLFSRRDRGVLGGSGDNR